MGAPFCGIVLFGQVKPVNIRVLFAAWADGAIKGLVARGGFEVAMKWKGGKLISAAVSNKKGGTCKVKYGNRVVEAKVQPGKAFSLFEETR